MKLVMAVCELVISWLYLAGQKKVIIVPALFYGKSDCESNQVTFSNYYEMFVPLKPAFIMVKMYIMGTLCSETVEVF